ncbi:MAG: NAD-dependent epimerase/dehydratase family protein, partial [Gammaproteobacteria bacterium]
MHVLVTGGTGFIGKALCRALRARGDQVSVLTRSAIRAYTVLPKDVAAVESLDELRGVDAVVNLAGENLVAGRWTEARKRRMLDSRLGITRSLIDWMQRGPAPRVLLSG